MLENNSRLAIEAAVVDEAIVSRRSVRAFLPDMVDDDTIRAILEVAARAGSPRGIGQVRDEATVRWREYRQRGIGIRARPAGRRIGKA